MKTEESAWSVRRVPATDRVEVKLVGLDLILLSTEVAALMGQQLVAAAEES